MLFATACANEQNDEEAGLFAYLLFYLVVLAEIGLAALFSTSNGRRCRCILLDTTCNVGAQSSRVVSAHSLMWSFCRRGRAAGALQ
jgi:hypothetical protein